MKRYKSILQPSEIKIEVNKSVFIASSEIVKSEQCALNFINSQKNKYKYATHHCTAMIIGEDSQIQRYNDDHEPQGTAGIPMLEVLRREELTNTIIVVTRYFGGTKLGASGLIRAYTKACTECVKESIIITMEPFIDVNISFRYSSIGVLENYLLNEQIMILEKTFLEEPSFLITIDLKRWKEVQNNLINITAGQINITECTQISRAIKKDHLIYPQE